jgi:hypothetical protein
MADTTQHPAPRGVLTDVMAMLLEATPVSGLAVTHSESRWNLVTIDGGEVVASFARPEDLDLFARTPAALRILSTTLAQVSLAHSGVAGGSCPADGQPAPCHTTRLLTAHLEEHLEASARRPEPTGREAYGARPEQ